MPFFLVRDPAPFCKRVGLQNEGTRPGQTAALPLRPLDSTLCPQAPTDALVSDVWLIATVAVWLGVSFWALWPR